MPDPSTAAAGAVDGVLVVDKPAGWTSHDVVARIRRLAGTRKVGHAGTLDPMATGVLVLGLGRATRLLGHLALGDKTYLATARLGVSTVSDDAEGEVIASTPADHLEAEAIEAAARRFVGEIEQVPSSVSAIKVDGRRSYARVRAGEDVVLAARRVTVSELLVTDVRIDVEAGVVDVDLTVTCSSGTYVRALARDLGAALGVGGHLTALRRTRVGTFTLAEALAPEDLSAPPEAVASETADNSEGGRRPLPLIALDTAVAAAFPRVDVDADAAVTISRAGRAPAPASVLERRLAGPLGVFGPDGLLALMEMREDALRSLVVFAPANAAEPRPARIDP